MLLSFLAISTCLPEMVTPVTLAPRDASSRDVPPSPHPTSSTRRPGAGSVEETCRRRSTRLSCACSLVSVALEASVGQ